MEPPLSTRSIKYMWVRNEDGPVLPNPGPQGIRPPNGFMWGHTVDDFFWLRRVPDLPSLVTVWSRSMIKEFGEDYEEEEHEREPSPRRRRPFPLLKLPIDMFGLSADFDRIGKLDILCGDWRNHEAGVLSLPDTWTGWPEDPEDRTDVKDNGPTELKSEKGTSTTSNSTDKGQVSGTDSDADSEVATSQSETNEENIILPRATQKLEELIPKLLFPDVLLVNDPEYLTAGEEDERVGNPEPRPPIRYIRVLPRFGDHEKANEASERMAKSPSEKVLVGVSGSVPASAYQENSSTLPPGVYVSDDDLILESASDTSDGVSLVSLEIPSEALPEDVSTHEAKATQNTLPGESAPVPEASPSLASSPSVSNTDRIPSPRVAHLDLTSAPCLGKGNHSIVYRGSLRLPPPLTAFTPNGEVTVAAKLAFSSRSARELLDNEARIYNEFPEHLMEEWCGFILASPIHNPVPTGAVVPKFYGYYVPFKAGKGKGDARMLHSLSPILLLEECGTPISAEMFSKEDINECFSLLIRLHRAGFVQNSFFERNILVQPGPLNLPWMKRSMEVPSFRIIDFGRAVNIAWYDRKKWQDESMAESNRAEEELKTWYNHWS